MKKNRSLSVVITTWMLVINSYMTSTLLTEKVVFSLTHSDNVEHEERKINRLDWQKFSTHGNIEMCAAQLISSLCRFAWRSLRPKHDWSWSRLPFFSWWKHLFLFSPFENHTAIINQHKLYWYGILRASGEAIDRTLEHRSFDWFQHVFFKLKNYKCQTILSLFHCDFKDSLPAHCWGFKSQFIAEFIDPT